MSITVEELKGGRRAGWDVDGGRRYTLQVRVTTGDPMVGPRAALLAVGVGAGSTYRSPLFTPASEYDFGCYLNSIEDEEEDGDGKSWRVTLGYKQYDWTKQNGGEGSGANPSAFQANPVNAPPLIKWSSETEEVACTHDRNGQPILNSAGDPFDPPLTRPLSTPIATITRTLSSFDPNWINQFKEHTNNATWCDFPADTVLCKDLTADKVYDPDWGVLWPQTIVLAFRPIVTTDTTDPSTPWVTKTSTLLAGWNQQVLNAGFRQKVGTVLQQIRTDGAPAPTPALLKADGTAAAPSDDPVYLTFETREQADFSLFNLPADLFSATAGSSPFGGS